MGLAGWSELWGRLRQLDLERRLGLHAPCPPVALQIDHEKLGLVRVRPVRRGRPRLEAAHALAAEPGLAPGSIFQPAGVAIDELVPRLRYLFERTGTRPGRVSLVLPDNLAKTMLIHVPERPASARQLAEIVRGQLRRGLPFRLDEARVSYQTLAGEGRRVVVLAVAVRRATIEHYERALEAVGARVGLVDLCTPNLINLCRDRVAEAARTQSDLALLNCDRNYFSLAIFRGQQLIFLRCKTYAPAGSDGNGAEADQVLRREVANSFSYYQDKLAGRGVGLVLLRSVARPLDEVRAWLTPLEIGPLQPIDPRRRLESAEAALAGELGQQLAPAVGAAAGRGR